jgi:hypothetical protein
MFSPPARWTNTTIGLRASAFPAVRKALADAIGADSCRWDLAIGSRSSDAPGKDQRGAEPDRNQAPNNATTAGTDRRFSVDRHLPPAPFPIASFWIATLAAARQSRRAKIQVLLNFIS